MAFFVGTETLVNTVTTGPQIQPSTAALTGGNAVMVWASSPLTIGTNYEIKGQFISPTGAKVGTEFAINTSTVAHQSQPEVTGLANGGFYVTWRSDDTNADGDGWAIMGQAFDASGTKVGAEIVVNTVTAGNQLTPWVTTLSDGNVLVAWEGLDAFNDGDANAVKAQIINPTTGAKVGSEFILNSQTTDAQTQVSVTGLDGGGFVAVWTTTDDTQDGDGDAIKGQRFANDGTLVGSEFLVNTQSTEGQYLPNVANLEGGGFVVTWQTRDSTQDGDSRALKGQIYDANGAAVGTEFLVNTESAGLQYGNVATGVPGGGFMVSWTTTDGTQDGSDSAVKAQLFDSTGAKVGSEFLVNTSTNRSQIDPTIAVLTNGDIIIGWRNQDSAIDGSSTSIQSQVFTLTIPSPTVTGISTDTGTSSSDGITSDATPIISGTAAVGTTVEVFADGQSLGTTAAVPASGIWSLDLSADPAWADGTYAITAVASNAGGASSNPSSAFSVTIDTEAPNVVPAPIGSEFVVNTTSQFSQTAPASAALDGGGFVAAWRDSTTDGIRARIFGADGQPVANDFAVSGQATTANSTAKLAGLQSGGFVVTWQARNSNGVDSDGSGVMARIYNADGTAAGAEFVVNTQTADNQFYADVAGLSDGRFIVAWNTRDTTQDGNGSAIKAQVFNADGTASGSEFLVNTETNRAQENVSIIALPTGGYLIVWQSDDRQQDNSFTSIKGQVFAADGTRVGTEFLINTTTTGGQIEPEVALLDGGGFVVSWYFQEFTNAGFTAEGFAQVFDANGNPVGSEIALPTPPGGSNIRVTAVGLDGGGFLLAWQTSDTTQDGNGGAVMAQAYDSTGTPVGDPFVLNASVQGDQSGPDVIRLEDGSIFATWQTSDSTQDGSSTAVMGQILSGPGPTVSGISDDTGASATDGRTTDASLIFSGTAEVGTTVEVFADGNSLGTTPVVPASGIWTLDLSAEPDAAAGTYQITAVATDAAGNTSPASAAFELTIGDDSVQLASGDDTIDITNLGSGVVDGQGGSDTAQVTGGGTVDISGLQLRNFEGISTDGTDTNLTLTETQARLISSMGGTNDSVTMTDYQFWGDMGNPTERSDATGLLNTLFANGAETVNWSEFGAQITARPDASGNGNVTITSTNTSGGSWSTSVMVLDSTGNRVSKTTQSTDGSTTTVSFVGDVPTTRTTTDIPGAASSRTETFDAAGRMTQRETTNDDGSTQTYVYDTAGRVDSIESTDATGLRSLRQFDDSGNRTTLTVTDVNNTHAGWASSTWTYDTSGSPTSRVLVEDNGNTRTETYSGGQLSQVVIADTDNDDPWTLMTQSYVGGVYDQQVIDYDSGPNLVMGSASGQRISQEDGADDRILGNGGADRFVFTQATMGQDVILDFEQGVDRLDLQGLRVSNLSQLNDVAQFAGAVGPNFVIDFGQGNSITLNGVTALTNADFYDLL